MSSHDFDLTIVGAGITGLTLAAVLADTPCRIAIVDQNPVPNFLGARAARPQKESVETSSAGEPPALPGLPTDFDQRVSAVNHASIAIFQSLGIWEDMQQLRVSPYEEMQVWDANSAANLHFSSTEVGQSCLGYIIEQAVMKMALLNYLQQKTQVQIFYGVKPRSIQEQAEAITLELDNGEQFHSRLLVGADGSHSWVATQSGLHSKTRPYQQSAVVTTVRTERSHQRSAWQRFLSTGPLAFLPLSDPQYCSIVWSTDPEQARSLQELPESEFNQVIAKALEYKLGKVKVETPRLIFTLQESHARNYVKPRIALIGDAAHTIHPLAGQGVNLGLLDAACLAEVIEDNINRQRDIGALPCLRRYERWRKGENQLMISAMAGFKTLFSNQSSLLAKARHLGFQLTDKLPLVKPFLIERAMGLRGDLPKRASFCNKQSQALSQIREVLKKDIKGETNHTDDFLATRK